MPPWPIAMPSSTAMVLNSRGDAARRRDRLGDDPADRLEVGVARHELGEAVGDRDDRLPADVRARYTGGAHKGACARHVAAVGDCAGPQLGHRRSLLRGRFRGRAQIGCYRAYAADPRSGQGVRNAGRSSRDRATSAPVGARRGRAAHGPVRVAGSPGRQATGPGESCRRLRQPPVRCPCTTGATRATISLHVRRRQRLHLDHVAQHRDPDQLRRRQFRAQLGVRAASSCGGDAAAAAGAATRRRKTAAAVSLFTRRADDRQQRCTGGRVLPDAEDEAGQALADAVERAVRDGVRMRPARARRRRSMAASKTCSLVPK